MLGDCEDPINIEPPTGSFFRVSKRRKMVSSVQVVEERQRVGFPLGSIFCPSSLSPCPHAV